MVFDKLVEFGSGRQVLMWLRDEHLSLPTLEHERPRAITWRRPTYRMVLSIVRSPFYAGAYAFGRRETRTRVVAGRATRTALIRDHHPGYISWEQFERNQRRLEENAHMKGTTARKAARGGRGLLAGLLRCARCGRMLLFHQKFIIRDAGPPPGWYDPNNRRPPCPANTTRSSGRASSPLSTPFSSWSSPASSATSTTRSWSSVTRASRSSSGCATRRPRAWTTRRWLGSNITSLGGHPSLKIGKLVETHKHDISQILQEALEHERATLRTYYTLLDQVRDKSVWLEEYAREQIQLEEQHIAEVEKMMRKPGELRPAG
jgi:Recombinase